MQTKPYMIDLGSSWHHGKYFSNLTYLGRKEFFFVGTQLSLSVRGAELPTFMNSHVLK
jgi:hypothetical protein